MAGYLLMGAHIMTILLLPLFARTNAIKGLGPIVSWFGIGAPRAALGNLGVVLAGFLLAKWSDAGKSVSPLLIMGVWGLAELYPPLTAKNFGVGTLPLFTPGVLILCAIAIRGVFARRRMIASGSGTIEPR